VPHRHHPDTARPTLTRLDPEDPAAGLVLMLHGGSANGLDPVGGRSASWRRSLWMMRQIADRVTGTGAGLWLLRYRVRGWNAPATSPPSPVVDARWALEEVRRELGHLPVVLLGHSMGARTGVAVADEPDVVGVVALAPWLPADEPNTTLTGKRLAVAHGSADHVTSAAQSREFCRRAGTVAAAVEFHDMGPVGHYLFRDVPAWNRFAVSRSLRQLGHQPPGG
jgi:predicted esterase